MSKPQGINRDESIAASPSREALRRIRELEAINAQITRHRDSLAAALDFIAADATITPEGCPEPWRSTLIEWVQAANHALSGEREAA